MKASRRTVLKLGATGLVGSAFTGVLALFPGAAFASRIHFPNLDIKQGFDFKKDFQVPHAFMKKLKLGTVQLREDVKVKGADDGADMQVVGVMAHFNWNGGKTDQMEFHIHVSPANAQVINQFMQTKGADKLPVEFDFVIYKYDAHAKKYYKAVFADAALRGFVIADTAALKAQMANSGIQKAPSNVVKQLSESIMHFKPAPEDMKFNIAVGDGKKMTTSFGVKQS
jgi:hypothetical protein